MRTLETMAIIYDILFYYSPNAKIILVNRMAKQNYSDCVTIATKSHFMWHLLLLLCDIALGRKSFKLSRVTSTDGPCPCPCQWVWAGGVDREYRHGSYTRNAPVRSLRQIHRNHFIETATFV